VSDARTVEVEPSAALAQVEITLKYDGKDVDDGTMPIDDVISALRGFSNAYGKLASLEDPEGQHQIRVSAINKSSFAVSIIAWAQQNQTLLAVSTPIAALIVTTIIKLIELKKAAKGQPPASVTINGNDNTVTFTTAGDNTQVIIPRKVYDLNVSKKLDAELGKIAHPLREGRVEAVSILAKDASGTISDPVTITNSEKSFFQGEETATTTTSKPVELDGHLISLSKDTNRGTFRMQNGNGVRYHLTGDDPSRMYRDFAYKGPVRVQCIATFDSNLELKGLDITSITPLQGELLLS
jgi:hypothetical protein